MTQLSPEKKRGTSDGDMDAVESLVRLLADSGLSPDRIEATLRKTTAPADLDLLADCYSRACAANTGHGKPRRAA